MIVGFGPILLGRVIRNRSRLNATLREKAERLRRERADQAEQAAATSAPGSPASCTTSSPTR